jgi:mannosyltransferase OCH1-like enzyme
MIWVGNEKPEYVHQNFMKWKELMPDWDCRLWTNEDLYNKEINKIFPVDFISSSNVPAQQADIMRYFIIRQFGGVYVDADITPHKSLNSILQKGLFVACHDLPVTWGYIAIGFFASIPNHFLLEEICKNVMHAKLNTQDIHMQTGPRLFGKVLEKFPKDFVLLPIESFYRNKIGDTLHNGVIRDNDFEQRYGHHEYAATWIKKKLDLDFLEIAYTWKQTPIFHTTTETLDTMYNFIKNKKRGIYLRYGDGDFNLECGKNDMYAEYSKELNKFIKISMGMRGTDVLIGMPFHSEKYNTLEDGMCLMNHGVPSEWIPQFISTLLKYNQEPIKDLYSSVALCYLSNKNPSKVVEFHKLLKCQNIVFVGNKQVDDCLISTLFGNITIRIDTEEKNAFKCRETIMRQFSESYVNTLSNLDYFVIVIASGCAGRAFSAELYQTFKGNFFIFDYGSLLDYFNGNISREYMKIAPPKSTEILPLLKTFGRNLIIITSVIETTKDHLNYSKIRSVYSAEERFEQTLETIKSVRFNIPDSVILFIECSPHSDMTYKISQLTDYYINVIDDDIKSSTVRKTAFKGQGESILMLEAFNFILKHKLDLKQGVKQIFKISGRYSLNEHFNYLQWNDNEKIVCKLTNLYDGKDGIHTFFYKFLSSQIMIIKDIYLQYLNDENMEKISIECFIKNQFDLINFKKINYLDPKIGIKVPWSCYKIIENF